MREMDVLVLPTMKKPAQILGFEFTALGEIELSLTRPFNLTGGPSVALCNGFTPEGLPISADRRTTFRGRHCPASRVCAGRCARSAVAATGDRALGYPCAAVEVFTNHAISGNGQSGHFRSTRPISTHRGLL
jgi:hypothetical protein